MTWKAWELQALCASLLFLVVGRHGAGPGARPFGCGSDANCVPLSTSPHLLLFLFLLGCTGSSLRHVNSEARHVGSSSLTGDQTGSSESLSPRSTREVPPHLFLLLLF